MILYFPASKTATGEDILELHVHGGNAVVKAVLAAIPNSLPLPSTSTNPNPHTHSIRYAEPGEFTRRAFYNNRLDLTHIEALGDTLAAETEQQRRLAIRGTTSTLADQYEAWRGQLLHARGILEAVIDFSEDQHFDDSPSEMLRPIVAQVRSLKRQLRASIQNASRGELLRSGINIALLGAPNAGKSSLLNRIVGREAAIVSGEAGTTRDIVDVGVDIGGFYCRFGDLAGLRSESDHHSGSQISEVEHEGIRRAIERALCADFVIVVLAVEPITSFVQGREDYSDRTVIIDDTHAITITPSLRSTLSQCNLTTQRLIIVVNKADLLPTQNAHGTREKIFSGIQAEITQHPAFVAVSNSASPSKLPLYAVSCKEAQVPGARGSEDPGGIQALLQGLTENFEAMTAAVLPENLHGQESYSNNGAMWQESLGASERQHILLEQCLGHLETFLGDVKASGDGVISAGLDDGEVDGRDVDVVLAAESLRSASGCLARITGRGEVGDVEEVLGVVFEK